MMNFVPESLSRVPDNLNYLPSGTFKVFIRRCPSVVFFTQKVNLPGVKLPPVEYKTPFPDIAETGDHLEFNPFQVTFIVDENLNNWLEIHSWMRNLGHADDFIEYAALEAKPDWTGESLKSEIILTILDSARDPFMHVTFHDCIPIDLTDISFDSTLTDAKYLTATATFNYTNFDYERVVEKTA